MTSLSQQRFADLAGVSQQAISLAIKRGYLACGEDGRLDPRHAGNAAWLKQHQQGSDVRGRALDTHVNGHNRRKAQRGTPKPEPSVDLSDAFIARLLAEHHAPDGRIVALLEEVKREIHALRRDVAAARQPLLNLRELEHEVGKMGFSLNVLAHQLTLGFAGKPLTMRPENFGYEPGPAPVKTGVFGPEEIAPTTRPRR
jgi:hypothetical protein